MCRWFCEKQRVLLKVSMKSRQWSRWSFKENSMPNHRSRMPVFPFIFSSHLRVRWVLRRCSNIDQSRCSMFFSPSLFALCLFLINVRRTCERGRRNETRCNLKIAILKGIRDSRWKFLWKLNFLFVSGSTNRKRRIWFASFRIPIHVFASHVQIFMEIRIKIIKS